MRLQATAKDTCAADPEQPFIPISHIAQPSDPTSRTALCGASLLGILATGDYRVCSECVRLAAEQEATRNSGGGTGGDDDAESQFDITARMVGRFDPMGVTEALEPIGAFAGGIEPSGSWVIQLKMTAINADAACREVTRALHAFSPDLVVHDVRPGAYEELADGEDATDVRLVEFIARLDPELQNEVLSRLEDLTRSEREGDGPSAAEE